MISRFKRPTSCTGRRTIRIVDPRASMYYMFFSLRGVQPSGQEPRRRSEFPGQHRFDSAWNYGSPLAGMMSLGTLQGDYLSETLIKQVHDVAQKSDRYVHLSIFRASQNTNARAIG